MSAGWVALVTLTMSTVIYTGSTVTVVRDEVCTREVFNVTCPPHHVVLLRSARYGRMRLGRCVRTDYGYVGCAVDALPSLDAACSGRRRCAFRVPDQRLHDAQPCPGDFTSYLDATYSCVPVATSTNDDDYRKMKFVRVAGRVGYLASEVTRETGFGSSHCPWLIEARPGQRIEITLFNFGRIGTTAAENEVLQSAVACRDVALVKDSLQRTPVKLCASDRRETLVYTTDTNVAHVHIYRKGLQAPHVPFLLKYSVIGCADVTAPQGATVARDGQTANYRCDDSATTWTMRCTNNTWAGVVRDCSVGTLWRMESLFDDEQPFPYSMLVVVAIGVFLGVFVGVVLLSLLFLYSKRRAMRSPPSDYSTAEKSTTGNTMTSQAETWRMDTAYVGGTLTSHASQRHLATADDTFDRDRRSSLSDDAGPYHCRHGVVQHVYETPQFGQKQSNTLCK